MATNISMINNGTREHDICILSLLLLLLKMSKPLLNLYRRVNKYNAKNKTVFCVPQVSESKYYFLFNCIK